MTLRATRLLVVLIALSSGPAFAQALIKEFNWGSGPAAGNLAGMMQELR